MSLQSLIDRRLAKEEHENKKPLQKEDFEEDKSLQNHLKPIREKETAIEQFAMDRDDRLGAAARYFLAVARGECPDARDCELSGLPKLEDTP